ncbi:flagellar basal body-associated FliL family protein [Ruixingdingia sedimenti]|uniref:Flagellar protein FliL n=1 Tax=Ruixingdingia sedimenti TaxID=3073604 RepID=A0ABU1FCW2_9RHOB|nr:flagellar basal body-associated FliL family protein [Xinfangfangia sp. LG-4]MDR5654686.1 flagellar basal body-associated FliL family protein [Xinfangfangia sp. LG-4]
MRKILPIILALIGLAGGMGAGYFLRPPAEVAAEGEGADPAPDAPTAAAAPAAVEYVKLNNQFIIPVVQNARVEALVILSLSLEVKTGATERVYSVEPKLRDSFLQVLFEHANAGGFNGAFTESINISALRRALLEAAQKTLQKDVTGVLISDMVRQDTT